jgi:hypothetical protein
MAKIYWSWKIPNELESKYQKAMKKWWTSPETKTPENNDTVSWSSTDISENNQNAWGTNRDLSEDIVF